MEGTVKFFNEAKGFGFVKEAGTEKEYFVHVSGLVDKIRENDKITFELNVMCVSMPGVMCDPYPSASTP